MDKPWFYPCHATGTVTDMADDDDWVTLAEAAEATGVSRSALRQWYRSDQIPSRLVPGPHGMQRVVPLLDVQARAARTMRPLTPYRRQPGRPGVTVSGDASAVGPLATGGDGLRVLVDALVAQAEARAAQAEERERRAEARAERAEALVDELRRALLDLQRSER